MALYCILFGLIARYHTVMYRCYSAPANYRVVHLVILLLAVMYIFVDQIFPRFSKPEKYPWEYILSEILMQILCSLKGFLDTHMVERSSKLCWSFFSFSFYQADWLRWKVSWSYFCLILIRLIIKHSWAKQHFYHFFAFLFVPPETVSLSRNCCPPAHLKRWKWSKNFIGEN